MPENTNLPITKTASDPVAAKLREDFAASQAAASVKAQNATQYASEQIDLPSEGHFYPEGSPLSAGKLDIKYMTAREEDILTSINLLKKGLALDRVLEALIVTPNVKLSEILVCDKEAISVNARILAYGADYESNIICSKCGKETLSKINLSGLKSKEVDFSKYPKGVNRFEFVLPTCKKVVTFKLLNGADIDTINAEIKSMAKISNNETSHERTIRLYHILTSVDGQSDTATIRKFVDDLLARDALALRRHIETVSPDFPIVFNFTCPHCDHQEELPIPIGVNFFWPDARV